jgi:hypothetical protein
MAMLHRVIAYNEQTAMESIRVGDNEIRLPGHTKTNAKIMTNYLLPKNARFVYM